MNLKVKTWTRFRFCWARKRADEGLPAPPLMTVTPQPSAQGLVMGERREITRYPYFFVHNSAEEAAYETRRRNDAVPPLPESDLRRAWTRKQGSRDIQGC